MTKVYVVVYKEEKFPFTLAAKKAACIAKALLHCRTVDPNITWKKLYRRGFRITKVIVAG